MVAGGNHLYPSLRTLSPSMARTPAGWVGGECPVRDHMGASPRRCCPCPGRAGGAGAPGPGRAVGPGRGALPCSLTQREDRVLGAVPAPVSHSAWPLPRLGTSVLVTGAPAPTALGVSGPLLPGQGGSAPLESPAFVTAGAAAGVTSVSAGRVSRKSRLAWEGLAPSQAGPRAVVLGSCPSRGACQLELSHPQACAGGTLTPGCRAGGLRRAWCPGAVPPAPGMAPPPGAAESPRTGLAP